MLRSALRVPPTLPPPVRPPLPVDRARRGRGALVGTERIPRGARPRDRGAPGAGVGRLRGDRRVVAPRPHLLSRRRRVDLRCAGPWLSVREPARRRGRASRGRPRRRAETAGPHGRSRAVADGAGHRHDGVDPGGSRRRLDAADLDLRSVRLRGRGARRLGARRRRCPRSAGVTPGLVARDGESRPGPGRERLRGHAGVAVGLRGAARGPGGAGLLRSVVLR